MLRWPIGIRAYICKSYKCIYMRLYMHSTLQYAYAAVRFLYARTLVLTLAYVHIYIRNCILPIYFWTFLHIGQRSKNVVLNRLGWRDLLVVRHEIIRITNNNSVLEHIKGQRMAAPESEFLLPCWRWSPTNQKIFWGGLRFVSNWCEQVEFISIAKLPTEFDVAVH